MLENKQNSQTQITGQLFIVHGKKIWQDRLIEEVKQLYS